MSLKITIPVKPYVNRYLMHIYGNCFQLTKRDHIGIFLFFLLQKNNEEKSYDYYMNQYSEKFIVELSDKKIFDWGTRYLTSYSISTFNQFIEHLIKDECHKFVDACIYTGSRQKDAIIAFMEKYNFSEQDIPYHTLKKSYQRYIGNLESDKNITAGIVPL